jgi:DNA-binding MarR family transcriptional regulator
MVKTFGTQAKQKSGMKNKAVIKDKTVISEKILPPDDFLSKFNTKDIFNSWLLLDFTSFAIARLRNYELAKINVTPEQAAILRILVRKGGKASISEIADAWMRQLNSITTLVRRMEKQGLVNVIKYPRVKTLEVKISEKGQEYFSQIKQAPIEIVYSILRPSEVQQLSSYLKKLLEQARSLLKSIEY